MSISLLWVQAASPTGDAYLARDGQPLHAGCKEAYSVLSDLGRGHNKRQRAYSSSNCQICATVISGMKGWLVNSNVSEKDEIGRKRAFTWFGQWSDSAEEVFISLKKDTDAGGFSLDDKELRTACQYAVQSYREKKRRIHNMILVSLIAVLGILTGIIVFRARPIKSCTSLEPDQSIKTVNISK